MQDLNEKLKLLKVVDLKAILAKAEVSAPPRANKADLISKIITSQPALDVYHSLYPPPENAKESQRSDICEAAPAELSTTPTPKFEIAIKPSDTEEDKLRKRAARFGMPEVKTIKDTNDDEKFNARVARFGTDPVAKKRTAPVEKVDAEEAEKRRKRAERFGLVA